MTKLRITPLGTCRIHTPLRRATARYPIELDLRRNYGFVHTSTEALQLLSYLEGRKTFRPEVAPLVFRDADPRQFDVQTWEPSDLHVIEISSAKRIMSGEDAVQSNYVQRHFSDFFASNARSRTYWSLVKKGNRQELIDYLDKQPSYHLLSQADRDLLASLTMDLQSFKAVKSDMAEMIERLGSDKILFVTHVNAVTPDDSPVPARDRLIRWVKLAADQLGASVLDPTALMEEFGQERALEDGGLDLTHYTLPFSDRLYDFVHQSHVAALIGGRFELDSGAAADQEVGRLAARLEAKLELGDFFEASREVYAALEDNPDAPQLVELRGLVRSRIGDFAGAFEDLTVRSEEAMLSQAMRIGLLEALSHLGRYDDALAVAQDLLGEEIESSRIYRAAAHAAERSGQMDLAVRFAKQAFRTDRDNLSLGLNALTLLVVKGDAAETAEWRRELLDNITASSSGAFELATWALKNRDEELFSAAFAVGSPYDKPGSIDLIEDAFAAGMMHATARSIPATVELGRLSPALADRRNKLIARVVETISPLYNSGRAAEAYELAHGLEQLADVASSQVAGPKLASEARRLIRHIAQHVRTEVRAAFSAGDMGEAARIGQAAGNVLLVDPDTAAVVARAMNELGRGDDALQLLKAALARTPDSFNARRWTGRFAGLQGDYGTALEAYGELEKIDPQKFRTVKPEVDRFFASVERRALKKLFQLAASGDEGALPLAEAITKYLGPLERTERELARLHRTLRLQLGQIEEGEGSLEEREAVLAKMVRIRPDDQSALRKLALELMRQLRFAEASEVWQKLHDLDPNNESADRNRVRCVALAKRRASVSNAELSDAG